MLRRLFFLTFLTLATLAAPTQPKAAGDVRGPQATDPFTSRIRGLFDYDLPALDPPGTVKLILHPHISDLVRRDYLRTDVGFNWALNQPWEFNAEASAFFNHGLRGKGAGSGIGEVRMGAKYVFQEWLRPDFETSAVLNISLPVGKPPVDLTDGHDHYTPGLVIQHHSTRDPKLTNFAEATVDIINKSSVVGFFARNQPHHDSLSFTTGAVYDLGQIKWTLAGTYSTTALISSASDHFFSLNPSLLWYVPKRMTFNYKTQWIVGLGTRVTWGPDGRDVSVNSRLRAEITFRQVMDKMRGRSQ